MKILLVAATKLELDPIIKQLNGKICSSNSDSNIIYKKLNIAILITGVGLVFTCYHLTKALNDQKYDIIINLGIAGSFSKNLQIGEVVHVKQEEFSDLGIETPEEFKTIFETGFIDKNEFPFNNGKLLAPECNHEQINQLKQVNGISSNRAHGAAKSIKSLIEKYNADIESMEGAAFFYACLMEKVNFIQIRAISNYVEVRNVKNWKIPLALNNLKDFIVVLLDDLSFNEKSCKNGLQHS